MKVVLMIASVCAEDSIQLLQNHRAHNHRSNSSSTLCNGKKDWFPKKCGAYLKLHPKLCKNKHFRWQCAQTCCENSNDLFKCKDFEWPPSKFCKNDAQCGEDEECKGKTPKWCKCDPKTGGVGLCSKIMKPTCQPKKDLCEQFRWPPTPVCETDRDCEDETTECKGCTASSCSCDPNTGEPGFCTTDCLKTCKPKCEGFEYDPGILCQDDKECGPSEYCNTATCTSSICSCDPKTGLGIICSKDCFGTCQPTCDDTEVCCPPDSTCSIPRGGTSKRCVGFDDSIKDEVPCPSTGCTCGESCNVNGIVGICQSDGTTCAQNIQEPECNDCDRSLFCGQAISCVDGKRYPTTCGPDNCDDPLPGKC